MDPRQLHSIDWNQIYQGIYWTAVFSAFWLLFLGCILIAAAVLPSLVATGHLRPITLRFRILLYPVALAALVMAASAITRAAGLLRGVMDFYPRFSW